jgi:hypothetical protein
MFGNVEASGEDAVAHGSPNIAREIRQPSAPPQSSAEKAEKGRGEGIFGIKVIFT